MHSFVMFSNILGQELKKPALAVKSRLMTSITVHLNPRVPAYGIKEPQLTKHLLQMETSVMINVTKAMDAKVPEKGRHGRRSLCDDGGQ